MSKKNKRGAVSRQEHLVSLHASLMASRHPLSLSQSRHDGALTSDNRAPTPFPSQLLDAPENSNFTENGFL